MNTARTLIVSIKEIVRIRIKVNVSQNLFAGHLCKAKKKPLRRGAPSDRFACVISVPPRTVPPRISRCS